MTETNVTVTPAGTLNLTTMLTIPTKTTNQRSHTSLVCLSMSLQGPKLAPHREMPLLALARLFPHEHTTRERVGAPLFHQQRTSSVCPSMEITRIEWTLWRTHSTIGSNRSKNENSTATPTVWLCTARVTWVRMRIGHAHETIQLMCFCSRTTRTRRGACTHGCP